MLDDEHTEEEDGSSKSNEEDNPAVFVFDVCKLHLPGIFKKQQTQPKMFTLAISISCLPILVLQSRIFFSNSNIALKFHLYFNGSKNFRTVKLSDRESSKMMPS